MPLSSERHIIDEKFRETLVNHAAQPTGRPWRQIAARLNNVTKKDNRGRVLLLTLLVLFLGAGTLVVTNSNQSEKSALSNQFSNEKTTTKGGVAQIESVSKISLPTDDQIAALGRGSQPKLNNGHSCSTIGSPASDSEVFAEVIGKNENPVNEAITLENFEDYYLELLASKDFNPDFTSNASKRKGNFKHAAPSKIYDNPKYYVAKVSGFYVGLGQTLNNTWVVDRKAIASDNLKYQPTFGTALMIHGGYNFNNHWGMEASWIISSLEGQKYRYLPSYTRTTSLEYYQKHISFNYMQVPLMIRYKVQGWSGVTQTPIFVNYSIGLQYGRLMSYGIDESKVKPTENDLYRRNEYAVVAGLDYDFLTKNPMFFTIGIRTSFSSNLFKEDVPNDLEFSRPHNVLVGLHGALNFSLDRELEKPVN